MASAAERKGSINPHSYARHLRPFGKRQQAKRVRQSGKDTHY